MAIATSPTAITKEEFERLPDAFERYEVVDGHLVEVERMGNVESGIAMIIGAEFIRFAAKGAIEVLGSDARFRLAHNPDLIRGCDVSYIPRDRMPDGKPNSGVGDYIPAIAVEVVSPSNGASEITRKIAEWFRAGTALVWIVYPEIQQIYVYTTPTACQILRLDDSLDGGDVLPGLSLPLAKVFVF